MAKGKRRWLMREAWPESESDHAYFRVIESPRKPRKVRTGRWQAKGDEGSICPACLHRLNRNLWLPPGGGPVELKG